MQRQRGVVVGLDKIREAHGCKLAHDLPHLRLRLSASQVEKGSGESTEDAELTSARRTGAREARVEALLQRGFFACRYAIAVPCLPTATMHHHRSRLLLSSLFIRFLSYGCKICGETGPFCLGMV